MIDISKHYTSLKFNFSPKDIIKHNTNEYLSIDREGMFYIRNFCSLIRSHLDIDNYYEQEESRLLNLNIIKNYKLLNASIDFEIYARSPSALLISSRYSSHQSIDKSQYLAVGINESLKKVGNNLDLYLCNNPYSNALTFLPKNNSRWPTGIFSYKTFPQFIEMYQGPRTGYNLPRSNNMNGLMNPHSHHYALEDHRSPVLSCLNLIFYLRKSKIILLGVENYIEEERPGAVYIKKGIYMYPQQILEFSILCAGTYWLDNYGIEIYTNNKNIDFVDHIKPLNENIQIYEER